MQPHQFVEECQRQPQVAFYYDNSDSGLLANEKSTKVTAGQPWRYGVSEIHSRDRISLLLMLDLSFHSKKLILVQARAAEKTKVDKDMQDHNLFAKPSSKDKDLEDPSRKIFWLRKFL